MIGRLLACLLLACGCLTTAAAIADDELVLVVSSESEIESLSKLDVRKAYLAVPVEYAGRPLRAQRMGSDERLNRIFLQAVVGMSRRSYERRLLSMALKFGNPRPPVQPDSESLLNALRVNPMAIAYMWRVDADREPDVKIVRVLWQDD